MPNLRAKRAVGATVDGPPTDVLVVGAGSAGCVIAARLSEDPHRRVLLVEAGPDVTESEEPASVLGPSVFEALAVPGRTWPNLVAQRVAGQPWRPYPRGRGTGGSSSVNAMIAMIAPPADYDRWERAHDCEGWGWTDLAPVFARLPIPLAPAPVVEWGPVDRALMDAVPAPWRAGPVPLTRWPDGRRASTSTVYLEPARRRPNLQVRGDSLVDRVLLDGRAARGVRLVDGTEIEAAEVVVAAGAIHSPAILLRSGVDRPGVGLGLAEHPSCSVALELREPVDAHRLAVATLATSVDAELQLLPMNHVGVATPGWAALALALMRTRSQGRVTLASNAPTVEPVVHLGLLSDERDVAAMVAGTQALREVLDHPAFRELCTGIYLDDLGTLWTSLGDDADAVHGWLRSSVGGYVHAAGTCRMGAGSDPDAVVDTSCRVVGYQGLRVCDASVFPELPAANPHLTVVAVAELLASRWERPSREP